MMEICPEKPGLLELLSAWGRGERSAMAWLAVGGICLLIVVNMLAIQVALA
jgi:hypothetical protein